MSYILRRVEPHFSRYAKDTIARVDTVAAEVGYTPNFMAASLRLQQLPYFGVFFEFVRPGDVSPAGGMPSMMWHVYEGIASTARQDRRYPVVLTSPDPGAGLADSPEELDRIVRSGLSGVIAAVYPETWNNHLARWETSGVPCISLFDPGCSDTPRWSVDLDNRAVGRQAWKYLLQRGHRNVICIHQEQYGQAVSDRIDAFRSARKEGGPGAQTVEFTYSTDEVGQIGPRDEEGILRILSETGATAIFAVDGGSSVLVYEALVRRGVEIPRECSLIGIDVPVWSSVAQTVTQVACPGRQVGQEAARLLATRIDGTGNAPRQVLVPPVLMERLSVAAL